MNFEYAQENRANLDIAGYEHTIFGLAAIAALSRVMRGEGNGQPLTSEDTDVLILAANLCMRSDGQTAIPLVGVSTELMQELASATRTVVAPTLSALFVPVAEGIAEHLEAIAGISANPSSPIRSSSDLDATVVRGANYRRLPG